MSGPADLTVVGAGFAGLCLAARAVEGGWPAAQVKVIARGLGSFALHPGTIDVSWDPEQLRAVLQGEAGSSIWGEDHPYRQLRAGELEQMFTRFAHVMAKAGLPYERCEQPGNFLLPTILGTAHPAWAVPRSLVAGDLGRPEPVLLVGFDQLPAVKVDWIAAALQRWSEERRHSGQPAPAAVSAVILATAPMLAAAGLPLGDLDGAYPQASLSAWGRLWERKAVWQWVSERLPRQPIWRELGEDSRILFPLLGWEQTEPARLYLGKALGRPVGELLGGLPSPAGVRLGQALLRLLAQAGVNCDWGRRVDQVSWVPAAQEGRWHLRGVVEETGERFGWQTRGLAWAAGWNNPLPLQRASGAGDLGLAGDPAQSRNAPESGGERWLVQAGESSWRSWRPEWAGSRSGSLLVSVEWAWRRLAASAGFGPGHGVQTGAAAHSLAGAGSLGEGSGDEPRMMTDLEEGAS